MRLRTAAIVILALAGLAFAQETNFQAGPQYLITNGSAMSLRPIVTPSLSLGEAQPFAANVSATEAVAGTVPTASAPSDTFLGSVYWGEHKDIEIVARRLETPSVTASETAVYMNAVANRVAGTSSTVAEESTGAAAGPVMIELAGGPVPSRLPPSIFDAGVTGMTNVQSLVVRGFGIPLGDVAAYWKSHKRTAPRVFTNADVRQRR